MNRKPIIAVIGAGKPSKRLSGLAEEVGRLIARQGALLVCGGLGGVMEAAARGAKAEGGQTLGILPGSDPDQANAYIDIPIATGIGYMRNALIIRAADGVIAIGGKEGTLSEVAYSLIEEKPLVSLDSWEIDASIPKAEDPQNAVEMLCKMMENGKGRR